ncbi:MAG: hypothetical protein IV100_26700 [Myxococcales bacterium]|nr:hypothetical protein [Myxococcales bacterium]
MTPRILAGSLAIAVGALVSCAGDSARIGAAEVTDATDATSVADVSGAIDTSDTVESDDTLVPDVEIPPPERGLPVIHQVDTAAAARGEAVFAEAWPGPGIVPQLALRHLYLTWTTDLFKIYGYYTGAPSYWAAFRERYGFVADPDAPDGLPIGFHSVSASTATVTCLVCHAGESPAGGALLGLPNARLDLQGFYDDLRALPAAFEALKAKDLPEPYGSLIKAIPVPDEVPSLAGMTDRTGAPGATDAMGLGFNFGALAIGRDPESDGLHTRFGYQNPNPWWTLAFKTVRYWDGSVPIGGHRTMMATLLGLGLDPTTLVSLDSTFHDVEQYLLTLRPPSWPFEAPNGDDVATGRALFDQHCARCHGTYDGDERTYPNHVVDLAEIGTDPERAAHFGEAEAIVANQLIADPAHRMVSTGGYLAPVLHGVWATAPYLHNGSVPDLTLVLDSESRPVRWRRATGEGAYDRERVGWRYEVVSGEPGPDSPPKTIDERRTIDARHPGLSNAGHTFGDAFTDAERAAVVAYLKTL